MFLLKLRPFALLILVVFFQDLFEFDEVNLEDVIEDTALNRSIKLRSLRRGSNQLKELANA